MGKVTDALLARIQRQVDEHGLVVWLDPERQYAALPALLRAQGLAVEVYEGSVFALRHRLEPALAGAEPPPLVVYVPLDETEARGPLCEAMAAGVVMRPGQPSPLRNTRLSVVARAALADVLPALVVDPLIRQVEAGSLTLAELDLVAEKGREVLSGALTLIYGTANPAEVALLFVDGTRYDEALQGKAAQPELASVLEVEYGCRFRDLSSAPRMREVFVRHAFGIELLHALGRDVPEPLRHLPRPERPRTRDACLELLRIWRNRVDLRPSFVDAAVAVEAEWRLDTLALPRTVLERLESFRCYERALQDTVERAVLEAAGPQLVELAEFRLGCFWPSVTPELMDRWALVAAIGRVLVIADRVEADVRDAKDDVSTLARRYTAPARPGGEPWCLLDTFHRHLESRYHHFDLDVTGGHATIEQLVAKARGRYTAAAARLAERFLVALHEARFRVTGLRGQRETFDQVVRPLLGAGKVAYLLVDGLRYEMARELETGLRSGHATALGCTVGTLPSVTEVGMAALLPRADEAPELVAVGGGKLALKVGGRVLRNRKERLDYLTDALAPRRVYATRLEALLPPNRAVREAIGAADLVVVTATDELDGLCETGNVPMARRLMDDALVQIQRGLKVLFDLGVQTAVVTADHGFLFGEVLDSGNLIDPPGGQTADLHRRVWVGKGGAASPSYLRVGVRETGLEGELEMALPWSLGGFKSGGGTAYFHGGASPQELLLAVLTVQRPAPARALAGDLTWALTPGSHTLSTRFLSVQIEGRATGLFEITAPLVRVELQEQRRPLSRAVAAAYGFQESTGCVQMQASDSHTLRANTVTLMLQDLPTGKRVTIALIEMPVERALASVEIGVALAGF